MNQAVEDQVKANLITAAIVGVITLGLVVWAVKWLGDRIPDIFKKKVGPS